MILSVLLFSNVLASTVPLYENTASVMGTEVQMQIALDAPNQRKHAEKAFTLVVNEFHRLDFLLSEWKKNSPLGELNAQAAGESVVLPQEAFDLLQRALAWSKRSDGAFDPSFASLWGLWRFDPGDEKRIPSAQEAKKRAILIDYKKIGLDQATKKVWLQQKGMKIGLGGIAKGYAVDRAVEILRAQGFRNFFIKAGGELFLSGKKGERPWQVGIQDPRNKTSFFATLALENSAFTTSGDYERFLIKDGVRYHHIIDPQTGYPAKRCRSASIVAPASEQADALSTTVFVLGPKKGLALVESLPHVEAVIVSASGEVVLSSGLKGKLALKEPTAYQGP